MLKTFAATLLATLPLLAATAQADTETTEADTLVVVTPNAPIIVNQGAAPQTPQAPQGDAPAATAAPANGAPQNEPWGNVSHINGTPVKVGERGDYLVKFRRTNLSANPFGILFGYYDVSFAHAITNNLAVAVSVTAWNMDSGSSEGYQLSASLPLYFRRTFSGPFLEGGLLVRADTSDEPVYDGYAYDCIDCTTYDDSRSWVAPEVLIGWHWSFDSGLNLVAAVGAARRLDGDHEAEGNGYFRVGYAF